MFLDEGCFFMSDNDDVPPPPEEDITDLDIPPPPEDSGEPEQSALNSSLQSLKDLRPDGKWTAFLFASKARTREQFLATFKNQLRSHEITNSFTGKKEVRWYIPIEVEVNGKREVVNVAINFSDKLTKRSKWVFDTGRERPRGDILFYVPKEIMLRGEIVKQVSEGLLPFMGIQQKDNRTLLIASGVRSDASSNEIISTVLKEHEVSLVITVEPEPIRTPTITPAQKTIIRLFRGENEREEPTLQSILVKLGDEQPLFKPYLEVHALNPSTNVEMVYDINDIESYHELLLFISKKLSKNDRPQEEYVAGRKLLDAIREHAIKRSILGIVSRVDGIISKFAETVEPVMPAPPEGWVDPSLADIPSPPVEPHPDDIIPSPPPPDHDEPIADKVVKLPEQIKTSVSNLFVTGIPYTVELIQKDKNYKILQKFISKCSAAERIALLNFISKKGKENNRSVQSISIIEILLKKSTPLGQSKIKFLSLLKELKKENFYYKSFDSMRKNKNYKTLVQLMNKCTDIEKTEMIQFIEAQKKQIPTREAEFIIDFNKILKIDTKMIPPPPVEPASVNANKSFPRLSLPSFSLRTRSVAILNIEASADVIFAHQENNGIKFSPVSSKTNLSTNTKRTDYSISPGDKGKGDSDENKAGYSALVKDIFEKLNSSHSKIATLSIPKDLDPNRAAMLKEAINVVRLDDKYKNLYLKVLDQNGQEIEKPSATVAPKPKTNV